MKTTLYIILLCLIAPALAAQPATQDAIKAYQGGDYTKAIEIFENEVKLQKEKGMESADLYYNLGNAYFRGNDFAKALLNYERAVLLEPGDADIRHNLQFARTRVEDKIIGVDTFFLQSWFDAIQNLQSSDDWATLSIVLFLLLIGALCAFFFTRVIVVKKTAFYSGIVLLVLLIFTNIFSVRLKNKILNRNTAIIMAGAVSIKSSPDVNSKELFILHSGTKVTINKTDGTWLEIEIDNGNVGWTTRDKLEII
ncbi:MAG: tetratricopeptide repeat protein [Prevotella sp.]|jgi:tetratricopeptide (TPR) repeat protein|nr:tetratricopeptide repeat protein [Prevotella sp.]